MQTLILTLCAAVMLQLQTVKAQEQNNNLPPQVSFIYPTNTLTLFAITNGIVVRGNASDPDGIVGQVRLLANGVPVAADLVAPYEFYFQPTAFGNLTLQLEALDNQGGSGLSVSRTIQYVQIYDHLTNNMPAVSGTNVVLRSSNVEATHQKGEPQHAGVPGGKSVWFAWRATVAGTVIIDTDGSDFDTVLAVYTNRFSQGVAVSNLVLVAANDNDSPIAPLSRVKFTAFPNSTYYIAVDGKDGFAGNIQLAIREARSSAAPNDLLGNATRISQGTYTANSIGASKEVGEPDHAGNPGGASLWFRVDLGGLNPVRITTQGSSFDTILAVYTNVSGRLPFQTNPPMSELRLAASNDDAQGTNRTSEVILQPQTFTSYWIAVDGYNGAEGAIRLMVSQQVQGTQLPNDRFINAFVLTGTSALTEVNTFFATTEPGESPRPGLPSFGKSVWYRWVAPASGPVYLSTEWSSFDTLLSVYTGTNINSLIPVAFNDDYAGLRTSALVFEATQGQEYRISVAGYQGASGDMVLILNQPRVILPRMIPQFAGGKISFSVDQAAERMLLEASSDLVAWHPVRWINAGEDIQPIEPSSERPQEFYRLVVVE